MVLQGNMCVLGGCVGGKRGGLVVTVSLTFNYTCGAWPYQLNPAVLC
jgi:hypothetical protein